MARSRLPDENGLLLCIDCQETKPISEFYRTGRTSGGRETYFSYCIPCKSTRERNKRTSQPVQDHRAKSKADCDFITCPSCEVTKPRTEFSFRKSGRQAGQPYLPCRECSNLRHREYLRRNPEVRKRHRKPAHQMPYYLAKYGLTVESFESLLAAQGGTCAICERDISQDGEAAAAIDHCHETGAVRGLLCKPHNAALGLLGDDPKLLDRAAQYLRGATNL